MTSQASKSLTVQKTKLAARSVYLTCYNIVFLLLWASSLFIAISHTSNGKLELFHATESYVRWVQTLSLIEVVHAALGIIKSPVSTTALQVVTRVIQVWMVWYTFPATTASSKAYLALLLAWSVADSIRYAYLALHLHKMAPKGLVWLRYTMFIPLYPIGIGAEWLLLYKAVAPGGKISGAIPPFFYLCLALYVPGAWTMYTYMIKQREKALRRGTKET